MQTHLQSDNKWPSVPRLVDDEEAFREGFTLPSEFNSRMSVIDVTGASEGSLLALGKKQGILPFFFAPLQLVVLYVHIP